jgi:hypothetical protein
MKVCDVVDSPVVEGVPFSVAFQSFWASEPESPANIYRIFDLITMKRFYADRLLSISRTASILAQSCSAGYSKLKASPVFRDNGTAQELHQFEKDCEELGLVVSAAEIRRLRKGIEEYDLTTETLANLAHCVIKVLGSELEACLFFKIGPGHSNLLDPLPHFGEDVSDLFPGASTDIAEASACLALERYPSCVFHSMLVLEHGLRWICLELSIPFPPFEQWQGILRDIDQELAKITPQKTDIKGRERKEFLAGLSAHFKMVKDGWRNHVTHGRGTNYGAGATESIYRSVRQVMIEIAEFHKRREE